MKTKMQTFLLFGSLVLAAATLAPTKPINPPPPPPGPGPYIYECPVRNSPLTDSSVRMLGTYCMVSCSYQDGKTTNILRPAPLGVCEATDGGAIYQ